MAFPTIGVKVAWTTTPFAVKPAWTSLPAGDIQGIHTRKGRSVYLDRIEASTASVVLENTSGDYWPDNAGGTYYPNVLPGKQIRIIATYSGTDYPLFTGFIEKMTPLWLGPGGKGSVMTLECSDIYRNLNRRLINDGSGYSQELSGVRVANVLEDLAAKVTATATLAEDLDTSETGVDVSDGPEFDIGQTILIDSEQMKISNIVSNTLTVTRGANGSTAATHTNGAAIKVYAIRRDLDVGQSSLQATGALVDQNALQHIHAIQTSEMGLIFIAGDGDVQFQDRHYRIVNEGPGAAAAVFGDDSGEMHYSGMETSYEDEMIYNDVRITRAGGAEQSASDATSQTSYGKRSLAESGLLILTDNEALDQATYMLSRFKDPSLRVQKLTISPGRDEANLYPKVLSYDISQRITVRLNEASIDTDYLIEGVEQDADAISRQWLTQWSLSAASIVDDYWKMDVSELDTETRLAY